MRSSTLQGHKSLDFAPEAQCSSTRRLAQVSDICVYIFTFEALVKSISMGFLCGEKAYLKSPWNNLDFGILCASYVAMLAEEFPQIQPLGSLRILRVLRPLQLVSLSPNPCRSAELSWSESPN